MVFEVQLVLKLRTGTTATDPKEAVDMVLRMLDDQLRTTSIGGLDRTGLFQVELARVVAEGLKGKHEGKIFELIDGKMEVR